MDSSEIVLACTFGCTTPTLLNSYEITMQIISETDCETLVYTANAGDAAILLHKDFLFINADGTVDEPDSKMTEALCRRALGVYLFSQPRYRGNIHGDLQQYIKETSARVTSTRLMTMAAEMHGEHCTDVCDGLRRTSKLAGLVADLIYKRTLAVNALVEARGDWRSS